MKSPPFLRGLTNILLAVCIPGNDVDPTTGLAAANIILFTTGLGTPTGNPVTPVIKVSINTKLAENMPDIIDFNTGKLSAVNKLSKTWLMNFWRRSLRQLAVRSQRP